MRYCFTICLLLVFACSKKPTTVEAPQCKLTSIASFGYSYYLTYDGSKIVKVGFEPPNTLGLVYGSTGKLAATERPATNPNYKTELFYNDEGRVSMEKDLENWGDNWRELNVFFYTYTNGKVTSIRETVQFTSPALEFHHEVIWDGDNIRSIVIRSGNTVVCSQQFNYDTTRKNFMGRFIDLYYGDNLGATYKLPLYYSANLLVKEDNICPSPQTTNITYDLSDSLHLRLFANNNPLLSYNYECH